MTKPHDAMSMDQKIFSMGFSVETTSVYLLCCGLADKKAPLTEENLFAAWPGSQASLKAALKTLKDRHIITEERKSDGPFYRLNPAGEWT